jgi:hypothetical protein
VDAREGELPPSLATHPQKQHQQQTKNNTNINPKNNTNINNKTEAVYTEGLTHPGGADFLRGIQSLSP